MTDTKSETKSPYAEALENLDDKACIEVGHTTQCSEDNNYKTEASKYFKCTCGVYDIDTKKLGKTIRRALRLADAIEREIESDILDAALHDIGTPNPKERKQWCRDFFKAMVAQLKREG